MKGCVFLLGGKWLKQVFDGHFLEYPHAEDLEDFVECGVAVEALFEDGHQRIDAHGHPQLCAHRAGAGAVKDLDPQMLLEPAKEQLDLPALLVEPCHRQGWQPEVIGQEHQGALVFGVVNPDAAQFVRIGLGRPELLQADNVIAAQAGGAVHRVGVLPAGPQGFFGGHHQPGARLLDGIEPPPVQVTPIHQIERARLPDQLIEPDHLRIRGQTYQQLRGQRRMDFQLRVDFEAGTLGIETRPGINRQTQIDDARIQGIDGLRQVQCHGLRHIKRPGLTQEVLGQIGEDAPVAGGQRVGQRAPPDWAAQAQVIALIGPGIETGFDVPQTFPPGQLGENQTHQLVPGREVFDFVIATITFDEAVKPFAMNQIENLGKDVLAAVHASRIGANPPSGHGPTSNRSHPTTALQTA